MDKKINVTFVRPTWDCCSYMWAIGVRYEIGDFPAVLATLKKWFNEAEFYWGTGKAGEYMFLCAKKAGR